MGCFAWSALVSLPALGSPTRTSLSGCIIILLVWRDTGFAAILFYSRLLTVDEAIYEAAALDRADGAID